MTRLLVGPGDTVADMADTSWLAGISVTQVVGALVVLALLVWALVRLNRLWRPVREFLDDWRGEAPRAGVPPRPGVMARLERIEQHLADVPTRREMTEVQQHLARHDVEIEQLQRARGGDA